MSIATGGSIEAVLTLNATGFTSGLETSLKAVETFKSAFTKSITPLANDVTRLESSLQLLSSTLNTASQLVNQFNVNAKSLSQFNTYATAVNKLANALKIFSSDTINAEQGLNVINSMFKYFQDTLNGTEVKIKGVITDFTQLANAEMELGNATRTSVEAQLQAVNSLNANRNAVMSLISGEHQLADAEKKVASSTMQESTNIEKDATAKEKASASTQRLANANKTLGNSLSMLRNGLTLVGSMIAYNFVHHLGQAVNETINAKSEMEGYFQMLHFSSSQIDDFNKSLDETVGKFQRINKYSLGETISSIGVEFNLTTEEMKKAMPVVSMITSEYLRAGRNANEASLAVKDILQGEFQRLSRETGVKGDQLKEAGWSGDKTDVMGLLDALDKVGKSRNWDVFVTKANSLNDAVMILQNRFGEWSADMVNVVQPTILAVFNNLMNFGQGLSQALSGAWEWLNGGSWEASATKIGLLGGSILAVSQALVMYRANMGLVEASQLGLTKSITAVIFGLRGQELAEVGVRNSIMAKILGLEAETIAEKGVTGAIAEKITSLQSSIVQQEADALATGMNSTAQQLATNTTKELTLAKETESAQEEVNTAMKELNTLETIKQEGANTGLVASLYMLGTAEIYDAEATGALATAWGVLNGVFMLSPIGWITLGILGLASAIYVLTGGLSDTWEKMKQFNDIMKDTGSAQKEAQKYLEQVKKDAGEDSKAFQDATESVDNFTHSLQSASYWYNHSQTEFNGLDLTITSTGKDVLKDYGITKEQAEEWNDNLDILGFGKQRYYKAEQVLNKQIKGENSNYANDLEQHLAKVKKNGGDLEEAYEKMTGNYQNLAYHSYVANTSDDWWEKSWNQLYAGMDQFWIDWDNFWADPQWSGAIDGMFKAIKLRFGITDDIFPKGEDIAKGWNSFWESVQKSIGDWQKGAMDFLQPLNDLGDEVNKFFADPLGYLGISIPTDWNIWKLFGLDGAFASDGSSDHPSFMEDLSAIVGFDIQAWVDSFMSDPIGTLGIDLSGFDIIGTLTDLIFGNHDDGDDSNDISWINSLFPPLDPSSIMTYVQDNIVTPMSDALYNGITSIPIVSDILSLFGLVDGENSGASQKGTDIGDAFKTKVEDVVRNIPILGDVLQFLGVIPQANGDAHDKGHGVGSNISDGTKAGMGSLGSFILQEFNDALAGIGRLGQEAYNTAQGWANQLWEGVNSVLQRHSPGFFHDEIKAEFGTDIPTAIDESGSTAYTSAQTYAQNMYAGMNSVQNEGFGLDGVVGDYQDDAQIIASSSEMMGITTTTAFNEMGLAINTTTGQMATDVGNQYTSMQQKQGTMLQTMKTQNLNAYNEMYLKSNQSLIQMRDSTSNVTNQMISAWTYMKDSIVASANQLKSQSTAHFNQLSATIGDFYGKIQNPSRWGAGSGSRPNVRTSRNTSVGRNIAHAFTRHGAGSSGSTYSGASTMTVGQAKRMLCPNGQCGSLFDGYSLTDVIDIRELIANLEGEHGFGWGDWSGNHFEYIRKTSNEWGMKSPRINLAGGIDTNANFKVGEFENGTPKVSFGTFQSIAESIFSTIPYRYYYDSAWKGSWLGALQAGACNCSDGADALIALASVFGFSGYKQWGKWGNDGHFWAVINGKAMDTTAWQKGYGWTSPKVSGYGSPMVRSGSPSSSSSNTNKTVNINIDMKDAVIYGVDDLENRIEEASKRAMREEFNDPYAVAL